MTNNITQREFKEIRDKLFCLIVFDDKTNQRIMTFGGFSMVRVIEEIRAYQKRGGNKFLLFNYVEGSPLSREISWNYEDYIKYIEVDK